MFVWLLIVSAIISYLISPFIISFLQIEGYTRKNFRGKLVPVGSGIVLVLTLVATLGITALILELNISATSTFVYSLVAWILGVGFFGLLDDLLGDRSVSGFLGHFREISKGRFTTGVLKALGSGVLSLYIALAFSSIPLYLIGNALILVLSVNTFNLLDLRPGRALKVFIIFWLALFLLGSRNEIWPWLAIFLGPAMLLLRIDLEEKAMLGDVGSNILGAIVGFSLVASTSGLAKFLLLAALILMQVITEKVSISATVEKIAPLKKFDEWGRKKGEL